MNHKLDKETPRFDVQLSFDEIGVLHRNSLQVDVHLHDILLHRVGEAEALERYFAERLIRPIRCGLVQRGTESVNLEINFYDVLV